MLRARVGGETVGPGDYWRLSTGERVHLDTPAPLPGETDVRYHKLPTSVIILGAPVAGLVYALFLPLIALAAVTGAAVIRLSTGLASGIARAASFGWRPSEAYFLGRRPGRPTAKKKAADSPEGLVRLDEVERKRAPRPKQK